MTHLLFALSGACPQWGGFVHILRISTNMLLYWLINRKIFTGEGVYYGRFETAFLKVLLHLFMKNAQGAASGRRGYPEAARRAFAGNKPLKPCNTAL
jgi:hypothetical protein